MFTIGFRIALMISIRPFVLAEISSLIRQTCILTGVHPPYDPHFRTSRPLLHRQGHETFDPSWGRGFGSMALGIGQDRRGVHAPARIDTGLLPSHNGRSTDIHIQGRSMERNCARQQACSISRFFGCASIIFHSNEYIQK